jgi:DNA-directed RNA polymerase subunit M/transcription elongation factor TFIIS
MTLTYSGTTQPENESVFTSSCSTCSQVILIKFDELEILKNQKLSQAIDAAEAEKIVNPIFDSNDFVRNVSNKLSLDYAKDAKVQDAKIECVKCKIKDTLLHPSFYITTVNEKYFT